MKKSNLPKFTDLLIEMLDEDKEFLNEFVNVTFDEFNNDGNLEYLLSSLKYIAKAHDGMSAISKKTGLSRQALYNAFKPNGNPKLSSFNSIVNALGFKLKIEPITKLDDEKLPSKTKKKLSTKAKHAIDYNDNEPARKIA